MGRGSSGKRGGSYWGFTDKADGTHEYEGDGVQQIAFFTNFSNYDKLINSMTTDEKYDFRSWTEGFFMDGEQYGKFSDMSTKGQRITRTFDKFLDESTLEHGVELTRLSTPELVLGKGKTKATLEELKAMEGQTVFSKGSMSFGAAAEGLSIGSDVNSAGGAWTKSVEYKLKIDKGTKGSGMWIGDERVNGWGARQREFMTNRDAYIKVGKSRYDAKRDIFVVDLHWEGIGEHDYS